MCPGIGLANVVLLLSVRRARVRLCPRKHGGGSLGYARGGIFRPVRGFCVHALGGNELRPVRGGGGSASEVAPAVRHQVIQERDQGAGGDGLPPRASMQPAKGGGAIDEL